MSGCAVSGGLNLSETKNEKRIPLRFTTEKSASIFYQSFFDNEDKTNTTKSMSLEFRGNFGWKYKVSDNVRLNDAFRGADKNNNGVISEKEAIEYVQSISKK